MSLINKMLQDLDARGTPAADAAAPHVRPVTRERYRFNRRAAAAVVVGSFAGLALAWLGMTRYQAAHQVAPTPAAPRTQATAGAAPGKAVGGMTSTITMAPVIASTPVAVTPPVSSVTEQAKPPMPAQAGAGAELRTPQRPREPAREHAENLLRPAAAEPKTVTPFEPDSEEARAARRAIAAELETRMAAQDAKQAAQLATAARKAGRRADPLATFAATGAVTGSDNAGAKSRRAEAEYRRALVLMQDGRMSETIAALEAALRIEPTHEAARQTLVGLLIEAKRPEDAMHQLQLALVHDARQPSLAVLLARLQIERGGPAIDTLTRTLPYAGNNADYYAFLAGALQREGRHREAAEQYQSALRTAPGNGVWWMGLGMSLQADKRNGEALEAFQRARASGVLSAELQAFVERRLQQLGR